MSDIKFGTDGWRAIIAGPFTFENVRRLTQAIALYYKKQTLPEIPRMVVGFDRRFLSEEFAQTVAEVLAGNGIEILLSDSPCSTPVVSYAIVKRKLTAGIIVTASHNPHTYSGIKIKADFGGPVAPEVTDAVEALVDQEPVRQISLEEAKHNKLIQVLNLDKDWERFVPRYVDLDLIRSRPFKVLVDSMHGTGAHAVERFLAGGKCKVTTVRGDRDAFFGGVHPEPIPRYLEASIEELKRKRYDIAVVTDGDADRIGALRPDGSFITPGQIMSLLLLHLTENKKWTGSVVKTLSNTSLLDRIAADKGLVLHETPVGFKHICKLMQEEDVLIGGEESGGIGLKNYIPERDGVVLAMLLLELMAVRGKGVVKILEEVEKKYGAFVQERWDIAYPEELKPKLMPALKANPPEKLGTKPVAEMKTFDGVKLVAKDGSWLLYRLSGTEPILRIYAESSSTVATRKLLRWGKELALGI
ncbi:MAG: phosphoglucomutase/phosphomannomutase family protein [Candidatus Omnitrophica bacterium]|nr:phosphoglucomutase/phosphomannomutase family protein [Candidatus Omnitrophota bacterium]